MDGFGSKQRTLAVDRWIDIVNGKGYKVNGSNQIQSTRPGSSNNFQPSIPPPPPGGGSSSSTTTVHSMSPWSFLDPETKRKKRIATYKAYAVEGKVKSAVKKGFRWFKIKCSQIIHG